MSESRPLGPGAILIYSSKPGFNSRRCQSEAHPEPGRPPGSRHSMTRVQVPEGLLAYSLRSPGQPAAGPGRPGYSKTDGPGPDSRSSGPAPPAIACTSTAGPRHRRPAGATVTRCRSLRPAETAAESGRTCERSSDKKCLAFMSEASFVSDPAALGQRLRSPVTVT